MKLCVCILLTLIIAQASAQKTDSVLSTIEVQPKFPGGVDAMLKYVAANTKYPRDAVRKRISGKVFVQFIIEKNGSITNVETLKGINASCDKEAARVVASMPNWSPGTQDGVPVRVRYVVPINFALSEKGARN